MIQLLNEYKSTRKELNHMLDLLGTTERDNEDKKQINSMIRDVTFIIDWIEQGGNPEEMRGVNIKNVYHMKYLPHMDILPDIVEQTERKPLVMTQEKRYMVRKLLEVWSDRERDCFLLHIADGKSMSDVADILGVTKSTVQTNVKRARDKLSEVSSDKQLILI